MTIYIVTDLGYGDSGKGTTVDFLARQGNSLVVRHNGGSQAGHNVVTDDGRHHEFSQFGAGTFAGASTFLSRFMLINPGDMVHEYQHLHQLGEGDVFGRTYVDDEARIITPWHQAVNQLVETARGENRHGSCGRGIGITMQQDIERPELTIRVKDIRRTGLLDKLTALRNYLNDIAPHGNPDDLHTQNLRSTKMTTDLANDYYRWYNMVNVVDSQWLADQGQKYEHLIFEGAQGVLLDEWYGFHPYTTWSTTTHENAMTLINESAPFDVSHGIVRLGVTRAYMTRHGAGPFVTEDKSLHFAEPHNTTGQWQGAFRQGHLDLLALRYAIGVCGGVDGLVVTHLDRAEYWNVVNQYAVDHFTVKDILLNRTPRDLEQQERLTRTLMRARPMFNKAVSTNALLAMLGTIAPIHITSHGPTHADKQWVRKDALV